MVIAFSVILIGLLLLIKPLQRNTFYVLHCAIVILSAYYVETHYFRIPPLLKNYSFILYYKTFLLFWFSFCFHKHCDCFGLLER